MKTKKAVGRPKMEGKRRVYIVPDDVHEFIMSNGGSKVITMMVRSIASARLARF